MSLGCTTRWQNIWETSKVLKLKISNLSSMIFWSAFLISQKCPTMSPHQKAIASSTSSLIWGLKEFSKVVESLTRPCSSLSCCETTPSIQVIVVSGSNPRDRFLLLEQKPVLCHEWSGMVKTCSVPLSGWKKSPAVVSSMAVEQPQLFRKLHQNWN